MLWKAGTIWLGVFPLLVAAAEESPRQISGIYPHLAMFNHEGECGTGAVVPWADRLWVITYAPHMPRGSSDKLYEITPDLRQIVRPESVGGTNANRMIHRESNQLFLGPYVIDGQRNVRVIPFSRMFGRHTGNARHLTDPAHKVYFMSMEEALYEVDVRTLEVQTRYFDEAIRSAEPKANLPGYHGKGLYSGQGRLVYANNGEHGQEALRNPFVASGVLASWDGQAWETVLRAQFTEVTGPGGLWGNENPETDPIWSIGWDARSLILMVLDAGRWRRYRLPKASHSYDGAHGWNTEWPRIRDIGEQDLLMTMHGALWRFPRRFGVADSAGIEPRSSYLKVIGDFARWQDHIVFGCDDTARNEFLNKRQAKGTIAAPQSQSNLWFTSPDRLDQLGPVLGRGAVWWNEAVEAGVPSDPYLLAGFGTRGVHLAHASDYEVRITVEGDEQGRGVWSRLADVPIPPKSHRWYELPESWRGIWVRLTADRQLARGTAFFHACGRDQRTATSPRQFDGLAGPDARQMTGGIIRARDQDRRTLHFAATGVGRQGQAEEIGLYELDADLTLRRVEDPAQYAWLQTHAAIPSRAGVLEVDEASVIYIDDSGRRFRLPKGDPGLQDERAWGPTRIAREVATERDLFHCYGSFYELPAENAGGFARVRPVCTHNRRIYDYCSYRGLLVLSGVDLELAGNNEHVIRSDDGRTGLWVGAIDDIWQMGKPRGTGGPWKNSPVQPGVPSDPYLMTGYDRKELELASDVNTTIVLELDISGQGDWYAYGSYDVSSGATRRDVLPASWQAYWLRFRSSNAAHVTAQLRYE